MSKGVHTLTTETWCLMEHRHRVLVHVNTIIGSSGNEILPHAVNITCKAMQNTFS